MDNLSSIDLIIGSIVLILGIKGFFSGFLKEIFSFLGLVLGVYIASAMSSKISLMAGESFLHIENKTILTLIVFLVIFAFIWLSLVTIGALLSKLVKATGLGFFNNILGFMIGGGKYFIIFALIMTTISNIKILKSTTEKFEKSSLIYPYLITTGDFLMQLNPKELINDKFEQKNSFYKIPNDENHT